MSTKTEVFCGFFLSCEVHVHSVSNTASQWHTHPCFQSGHPHTTTTTLLLHPLNGLFSRTTWLSPHQKGKPFWILLQDMMGGSGISWTICKSFAPRSRQTTMPVPHHSVFTGRMPFLPPNQECQSTEGIADHPQLNSGTINPSHQLLRVKKLPNVSTDTVAGNA